MLLYDKSYRRASKLLLHQSMVINRYLGMDTSPGPATKQDLEYLQTQMRNVYATQAEHADRLMRLEQRQDGESRYRPALGSQSPFSALPNGVHQNGELCLPATIDGL